MLLGVGIYRWLGDTLASVCRPGERVVLVTEADAFGSLTVARQLGIAVGVVEGLLLDLNALDPDTRVDVRTATWRQVLGKLKPHKGAGRAAQKAAAVAWVKATHGVEMPHDAAEAVCIAEWWARAHAESWGRHVRPTPVTPTGMRKR